jgi:O-antigen ligase
MVARARIELGAYVALLFMIPARLVVPGFGAAGSPAALLALVLLGILLIERLGYGAGRYPNAINPVVIALACYFGWLLLSWALGRTNALTPLVSSNSDRKLIALASLAGIAWFVIARVKSVRSTFWLIDAILFCSMFMCLIGLIQFYIGIDPIEWIRIPGLVNNQDRMAAVDTRSIFNRPFGTALHPIEYGVVAAALLPLAWWRAQSGGFWYRCIPAVLALSAMVSISRSAVLAAAVGMGIIFIGSTWRSRVNLAVGGLLFIMAAGTMIPGLVGTLRSLFGYTDSDPSIQARVERTPEVLRLIAEHPWFGRGLGTFTIEEDLLLDNEIQAMAIETGVVGVAIFVGFILVVVSAANFPRQRDDRLDGLGTALTASILAIALSFYTFDAFFYRILMGLFFLNVALVGVIWNLSQPVPTTGTSEARRASPAQEWQAIE